MKDRLGFGKYMDVPIREVPTGYLMWILESLDSPPAVAILELSRRGVADVADGELFVATTESSERRSRPSRRPSRRKDHVRRPPSTVKGSGWIVGENYERLLGEWLAAGGDPESCPFGAEESAMAHLKSIVAEER